MVGLKRDLLSAQRVGEKAKTAARGDLSGYGSREGDYNGGIIYSLTLVRCGQPSAR